MRSASVGLRLYGRGDAAKKTGKGSALNIPSINRIAERLFHELFAGARGQQIPTVE
jgi:hypothetical protein